MQSKKYLGQVMTPEWIVDKMLDEVGYNGSNMLNMVVLEPSFGEGVFLLNMIERFVTYAKKLEYTSTDIENLLKRNIFGIEKDKLFYNKCIRQVKEKLNYYKLKENTLSNNLILGDALVKYNNFAGKIDLVIGNPPYVKVHNMDKDTLNVIKKIGSNHNELYVTFFEIGLKCLKDSGKLIFITPNSYFKNKSQEIFRKTLIENKLLYKIIDFKEKQVFDKVSVYSCITFLDKKNNQDSIQYVDASGNNEISIKINHDKFNEFMPDNFWLFSSLRDMNFIKKNKSLPTKLQDIAKVQNGIATNCDSVYILKVYTDKNLTNKYVGKNTDENIPVYFNAKTNNKTYEIESKILRRCIKASTFEGNIENDYIIYPYDDSGKAFTEEFIKTNYPKAYKYLCDNKDLLLDRDIKDNNKWYLFARSQGLNQVGKQKIVFKNIFSKDLSEVLVHILEPDIIVYSKIFIVPSEGYNIEDIVKIITSKDFLKYIKLVGKDKSGGYLEVNSKILGEFGIKSSTKCKN